MADKNPYIKIEGVEFHRDCKKLKLDVFKETHKHLAKRVNLEKAHKKLQDS